VLDLPFLYIARYWVVGKVAMVKQNDYELSSNNYQLLCLSIMQTEKQNNYSRCFLKMGI